MIEHVKTLAVNFWGGPGAGKSTLAAGTFAELKCRGYNCELVFEYIKTWAWESRVPSKYDELYIFGQQVRRESLLYGKVRVLLTDRPLAMSGFYAQHLGQPELARAMKAAADAHYNLMRGDGHRTMDIIVSRTGDYNPAGRYQDAAEARTLDKLMVEELPQSTPVLTKQQTKAAAYLIIRELDRLGDKV